MVTTHSCATSCPALWARSSHTLGAIIYLYTTFVVAYVLSVMLLHDKNLPIDWNVQLLIGLVTMISLPSRSGFFANINYVGLHRFYRDRLMEAFIRRPMHR